MADFPLLLEAPDHGWAEHVRSLMQAGLGSRGSVQVELPPETESPPPAGYRLTGMAVCDEPEDEMLRLITSKLGDYKVCAQPLGGVTQITVAPPDA